MSQPQNMGPPLPHHTEREMAQSKAIATQFYAADSQLGQADREQLAQMFGNKLTIFPLIGFPVIFAAIMAPNWLKKTGFMAKNRPTRGLQVILGLTGVFAGFGFSQRVAGAYQRSKLADKPASQEAYSILSQYPPQLGSRYYALTAKSPNLALKDPATIDWSRELAFPLMLVMRQPRKGEYPTPWAPGPIGEGQPQTNNGWNQNQSQIQSQNQNQSESNGWNQPSQNQNNGWTVNQSKERIPPSVGSPGNTWDKVRRENLGLDQGPLRTAGSSQPVPAVKTWDSDPIDDGNRDAAQRDFDRLMDRERHGEEGVNDDFSQSEEKWS